MKVNAIHNRPEIGREVGKRLTQCKKEAQMHVLGTLGHKYEVGNGCGMQIGGC